MSRRDGERVHCGDEENHTSHAYMSWDGANLRCPGALACEECGNDDAREGQRVCGDCQEAQR